MGSLKFSSTPSIEYNLLEQGLWKYDQAFSPRYQQENRFYSWDKAYNKAQYNVLKSVKELKHGFNFGFNLSKRIESSQLIYSFATRNQTNNLFDYYREYTNELFAIGDYLYKYISNVYEKNTGRKLVSSVNVNEINKNKISPFLKLISIRNNKRSK